MSHHIRPSNRLTSRLSPEDTLKSCAFLPRQINACLPGQNVESLDGSKLMNIRALLREGFLIGEEAASRGTGVLDAGI